MSRNASCPCGSGEKYKSCCKDLLTEEQENYYALLHRENVLKEKLTRWIIFKCKQDSQFESDVMLESNFTDEQEEYKYLDYLFFEFKYNNQRVIELARKENPELFEPIEMEILNEWTDTYTSLFEVAELNKNSWSIKLKDLFSGNLILITDRIGSSSFIRGDLIFVRIQKIFFNYYLSGVGNNYPKSLLEQIITFIKKSAKQKKISEYEFMANSKMLAEFSPIREIKGQDGEEICVCEKTYSYDINKIDKILDEFDADKRFVIGFVDFPKSGFREADVSFISQGRKCNDGGVYFQNFVMNVEGKQIEVSGSIHIKPGTAKLFSTSKKKAEELHRIVLEKGFILKNESLTPIEKLLAKGVESKPKRKTKKIIELEKQFKEKYYVEWCDKTIPALGNMTPRNALKTKKGRELLKELLFEFENFEEHQKKDSEFVFSCLEIIRKELNFYE